MKYYFLCMMFFVFGIPQAQTCSYTLLGEITDFHDGTPIPAANIYIKEQDRYIISDLDGKFKIEELCEGTITLVISHIACETKSIEIPITGDVFKSVSLEHHIEELNEVSVKAKEKTITSTAQESTIKSDVLKRYSSRNLGDALKEVPGVSSINTGNTIVKPMINGLHSSRILILNNNVRLQDQEWGVEHAPNIDINNADRISVIKGSGALAYGGDAIGGVIVINPERSIRKDTLNGHTTLNGQTNGRGYSISSSLNKYFESGWYAKVQGTLRQNGDFESPDYNLTNTGIKSKGFNIQAGKRTFESGFEVFYSFIDNEIGILSSSHIGNINDLIVAINSQQPAIVRDFSYDIINPRQDVSHHLLKAQYFKRFSKFGKVSLQYDYQRNNRLEFDIRRGARNNDAALDLLLKTHTLLADVNLDANLDRKVNFGFMARYQDNFAPDTGLRRLIPNYEKYDFGAYITTEWRLNEALLIDAGFRYDFSRVDALKFYQISRWEERGYDQDFTDLIIPAPPNISYGGNYLTNPIFDYHNISAAFGAKYEINEEQHLLANYSLSSRPPNPAELFSDGLHHSAARIELGDLRLDSEVSNRISLTYNYEKPRFNIMIDGFFNAIGSYMYLRPTGVQQSNRGSYPVWEYEQTDAILFGADMSSNYNFAEQWSWSNKTSFIKGYDDNDVPLINIPAFSTLNKIDYSLPQWYNFKTSLQSEWVFEQNEFPDFNFLVDNPSTGETVVLDISTPPAAYNLFHFYSEATFPLSKQTNLNVAFGIQNIFNTSYRNYLNRLRYFADDLGRNITLQLKLNY